MVAGVAALIALSAWASPAWAVGLAIRNDTNMPLYVQGGTVVNNVVRKGRPYLLNPGQVVADQALPGPKRLTIYDPRQPARILLDDTFILGQVDLILSIRADVQVLPNGVKVPIIRVVPVNPPAILPVPRR